MGDIGFRLLNLILPTGLFQATSPKKDGYFVAHPMFEGFADSDPEPELLHCCHEVQRIVRAVEDLVSHLTDAQLEWKPHPREWSIALCLEHLAVTAGADLPHLRRAISEGRAQGILGRGPFRYGVSSSLLIAVMGPQVRFRFKAPAVYRPVGDIPPREAIHEFFRRQQEILDCLHEASGLHLARTKMSLPGHRFLKMSIGQEFKLLVVHEQRHIKQAERIRNHPGFAQ